MPRKLSFIFKSDKEKILQKLEYYGIKNLPFLLCYSGKEKIRGYSGNLSIQEIQELNDAVSIEIAGMYLFNYYEANDELRLSFDAISALKSQITKNIIELDDKQSEEFMKGRDIMFNEQEKIKFKDEPHGFKIIRQTSTGDFLGTGKLSEARISNYMPKERRLR
jgi:NOL1/NOP2/fmu family ribosome biogenesis protein